MKLSSLIGHVVEVFGTFRAQPTKPADAVLRSFFVRRKYLGSRDRRFVSETYYGSIRHVRRLEAIVADATGLAVADPTRLAVAPDAAIVLAYLVAVRSMAPSEIVAALPEMRGVAIDGDAVWRMSDRSREIVRLSTLGQDERLGVAYSYPSWFAARLIREYGVADSEGLLSALNEEAPTVLRTNTLVVANREELAEELKSEGQATRFSDVAQDALVFPERVTVQGLASYKRGAFEIQDEGSQLIGPFARLPHGAAKVLDACAGAGGKTLHLAALLRNRGEIFATDVDTYKLRELRKRVRRSTAQNIRIVEPGEHEKYLGVHKHRTFDMVLLDVPCSGTGTIRRNPGIKWVLTEEMVRELIAKQAAILEANADYVKVGGRLVYATCSILKEEGEEQVESFLSVRPEFRLEETLRTRPDREGCDGFFVARLVRVG